MKENLTSSLVEGEMENASIATRDEHTGARDDGTPGRAMLRLSGTRAGRRAARSAQTSDDPTDLYLQELADSVPLSREQEVELGRRIESAERAAAEAWVGSRVALRELGTLADELEAGRVDIDDLLLNPGANEMHSDSAPVRLAHLLGLARSMSAARRVTAGAARARADLAAGIADVRPAPIVQERVERALREAADQATAPERGALEAALAATVDARRVVAQARAELVKANLRLVVAAARQLKHRGVPMLDLVQEGNLGLIRAADKFDYRRGCRFATYAAWWIRQALSRALLYQGKVVKVPVHLADSRRRELSARRALEHEHGREAALEEIAERSGLSVEKIQRLRSVALEPLSLDAPITDEEGARRGDLFASDDAPPDEVLIHRRMHEQARALLDALTPREREVLRLRFGFDDEQAHTLQEIGDILALSRERIRQIEANALKKLQALSQRHPPRELAVEGARMAERNGGQGPP